MRPHERGYPDSWRETARVSNKKAHIPWGCGETGQATRVHLHNLGRPPKLYEIVLMKMPLLTETQLALSFRTILADLMVPEQSVTCVRPYAAAPLRMTSRTSRVASPLPGSALPVE